MDDESKSELEFLDGLFASLSKHGVSHFYDREKRIEIFMLPAATATQGFAGIDRTFAPKKIATKEPSNIEALDKAWAELTGNATKGKGVEVRDKPSNDEAPQEDGSSISSDIDFVLRPPIDVTNPSE